jgi:H+/gluconate symporter-like permease
LRTAEVFAGVELLLGVATFACGRGVSFSLFEPPHPPSIEANIKTKVNIVTLITSFLLGLLVIIIVVLRSCGSSGRIVLCRRIHHRPDAELVNKPAALVSRIHQQHHACSVKQQKREI